MIFLPLTNSYAEKLPSQYGDKVTVRAEITNLKINYNGGFADFNDPFGFNTGEVALLYSFAESGHQYKIEEELNLSDWDLQWHDSVPHSKPTTGREKINKQFADQVKYVHVECQPVEKLETVFTVYNVNGHWPDWEGILVDSAKAAGFATLRELAIATGYVASEHLTLGGLAVAALASAAISNIILTIRGNESLGMGAFEVDLSELEDNEERTFVVTTNATRYGSAEITFLVKKTTEDIPCSQVTQSNTSLNEDQFYALLDQEFSGPEIPGWVKNNAGWWADGIVSDREFANAIGYLVKGEVIHVNTQVNSDGTMLVSENPRIPGWIKNNAGWWADSIISDVEFLSAIEYMINQRIISFSQRPSNLQPIEPTPDILTKAYSANKWEEIAAKITLEAKNFEYHIFQSLADKSWKEYSLNKNKPLMEESVFLQEKAKSAETEMTLALELYNLIKTNSESIKSLSQRAGVSILELEDSVEKQNKIKIEKIDSVQSLEDEIKMAKNAINNGNNIKTEIVVDYCDTIETMSLQDCAGVATTGSPLKIIFIEKDGFKFTIFVPGNYSCDIDYLPTDGLVCEIDKGGRYGSLLDIKTSNCDPEKLQDYLHDYCSPVTNTEDTPNEESIFDILENLLDGSWISIKEQCDLGSLDCEYDCEAPSCFYPEPPSEEAENTEPEKETGKTVVVLVIGGKYYPLSQFHEVSAHTPNCDALHYHSEFTSVRSTDGTYISDPSKTTCGFGKVGLIPVDVVTMTAEEIDAFKQEMGFEP